MPHNQGEVSRRIWTGLFAVTLGQGDDAVDAGDGDVLDFAIGPVDFDVVDFGRCAKAEVQASGRSMER